MVRVIVISPHNINPFQTDLVHITSMGNFNQFRHGANINEELISITPQKA